VFVRCTHTCSLSSEATIFRDVLETAAMRPPP
jgi:hypothetical protein